MHTHKIQDNHRTVYLPEEQIAPACMRMSYLLRNREHVIRE